MIQSTAAAGNSSFSVFTCSWLTLTKRRPAIRTVHITSSRLTHFISRFGRWTWGLIRTTQPISSASTGTAAMANSGTCRMERKAM